jgi:hypothetical protein
VTDGLTTVAHIRINRTISEKSRVNDGHCTFAIAFRAIVSSGVNVEAGSIIRLDPGRVYQQVFRESWESLEITVPIAFLKKATSIKLHQNVGNCNHAFTPYKLPQPFIRQSKIIAIMCSS